MRISIVALVVSLLVATSGVAQQPGPMPLLGAWSGTAAGQGGMDRLATQFNPDGTFLFAHQLPNGSVERRWGQYRVTPNGPNQMRVDFQIAGWLPHQICAQAPGFPVNCRPYNVPTNSTWNVIQQSPGMFQFDGVSMARDSMPGLLQQAVPDRVVNAVPAPVAPVMRQPVVPGGQSTPFNRPGLGNNCDDLQQQRICSINNGNLVTSGGCLKCIGP